MVVFFFFRFNADHGAVSEEEASEGPCVWRVVLVRGVVVVVDFEAGAHHQCGRDASAAGPHAFPEDKGLPLASVHPAVLVDSVENSLHGACGLCDVCVALGQLCEK